MYNIQTLNKISEKGLKLLTKGYNIEDKPVNPDAILVRSAKMQGMEFGDALVAIARAGAGTNNIPVEECAEKGIVVFNTPGANANAVKELVVAGLLLSSRKIVDGINWAQTLETDVAKTIEQGKSQFEGPELAGKTLAVVGLGAIGVMVANVAHSLGMEVIGYDPYISVQAAWGLSRHISYAESIDEVLASADYISIHVPLLKDTTKMFNAELFGKVKPGVRLLNFSRDGLVNNDDLKVALEEGKVSCYVTDFPTEELLGNDKILAIPHLGASTPESEENCAIMAANQTKDYLENGNIVNSVNFPHCEMSWNTNCRITIMHKNVPNMVGQITSALAKEHINIMDMMNKSAGDWAYTMIDTSTEVGASTLPELEKIEGIIRMRLLTK
ncbi:MAG TPA: phosphoglycerate dehydrogenase [Epulopiscium sp.]|nr:phosphoglycerate dehydrogenase [Candidatus Epulonipiscium sp.]